MAEDDPLLGHGRQIIVREDWLRLTEEPILEPDLPIVDPHHHLWERDGRPCPVLPQLLADTASGHDIRATIFVQCGEMYRASAAGRRAVAGRDGVRDRRCGGERERPSRTDAGLRRYHRHGRPHAGRPGRAAAGGASRRRGWALLRHPQPHRLAFVARRHVQPGDEAAGTAGASVLRRRRAAAGEAGTAARRLGAITRSSRTW